MIWSNSVAREYTFTKRQNLQSCNSWSIPCNNRLKRRYNRDRMSQGDVVFFYVLFLMQNPLFPEFTPGKVDCSLKLHDINFEIT